MLATGAISGSKYKVNTTGHEHVYDIKLYNSVMYVWISTTSNTSALLMSYNTTSSTFGTTYSVTTDQWRFIDRNTGDR